MPFNQINGAQIYYEETGSGPETIVFSHGLLMSGEMFSEQVKALSGRWLSFRLVIKPLMKIMFGRSFLEDPAKEATRAKWRNHLLGLNRVGTSRAAHGVIDRGGVYDQLPAINTPTLIIVGKEDVATPPVKSERMRDAIRGGRVESSFQGRTFLDHRRTRSHYAGPRGIYRSEFIGNRRRNSVIVV